MGYVAEPSHRTESTLLIPTTISNAKFLPMPTFFVPPVMTTPTSTSTTPISLFAARCLDHSTASSVRATYHTAHTSWIKTQAPNLHFYGPLFHQPDAPPIGNFFIWRASEKDTVDSVAQCMQQDPFTKQGVFQHVDIRRWTCGIRSEGELERRLYVVWCLDSEGKLGLRKETRPEHLEWIKKSARRGMVGPFPVEGGAVGSLLVIEGESKEEVGRWLEEDPYNQVGLFDSVGVYEVEKGVVEGVVVGA